MTALTPRIVGKRCRLPAVIERSNPDSSVAREGTPVSACGSVLWITIGALLNHANVVLGLNMSAADICLPIGLFYLARQRDFRIPRVGLLVCIALLSFYAFVGGFVSPMIFGFQPSISLILRDLAKLAVLMLYLLLGANLSSRELLKLLRSFVVVAIGVVLVGLLVAFGHVSFLLPYLFFLGVRFIGLMNDPNYQAMVLLFGLVIVTKLLRSGVVKLCASAVLVAGMLLTGSKTGFLSLGVVLLYLVSVNPPVEGTGPRTGGARPLIVFVTLVMILLGGGGWLAGILQMVLEVVPGGKRILPLLQNFSASVDDQGSGRGAAWETALSIIDQSSVVGIGAGAYDPVAHIVGSRGTIAHNTYLQLAVEWGIPVALALLFFCVITVFRRRHITGESAIVLAIARGVGLAIIVGSFGISLNNVRLFWVLLGFCMSLSRLPAACASEASPRLTG